jgi:hypothetical protein
VKAAATLSIFSLTLLSCSSSTNAPAPARPGTPQFTWGVARQAYQVGDYDKAASSLSQLAGSENPYKEKAAPWALLLSASVAKGNMDLAEQYQAGAKANRNQSGGFRKEISILKNAAGAAALQSAEIIHKYLEGKIPDSIPLGFGDPGGSLEPPTEIGKMLKGIYPPDAERENIRKAMIIRAMLRMTCKVTDAGEDAGKARQLLAQADPSVPKGTYFLTIAGALNDISEVYSSKNLDDPNRQAVVLREALEALKLAPQNKASKDLTAKINATLKKIRKAPNT